MEPSAVVRTAGAQLHNTDTKNDNASAALEAILGEALPANVCAVKVANRTASALRYQLTDAADANAASLVQNETETFHGSKTHLDRLRFYTGGANAVDFAVYI
jgi:hypothetical protein